MLISTRGRYALRVMVDMAEHYQSSYIPMKDIAARQNISLKYLERILPVLAKNRLIEGVHGKGGGYRLCRFPYQYRVGEILRLTEGDLASVPYSREEPDTGDYSEGSRTKNLWEGLNKVIADYLDNITLDELVVQGAFYLDYL